MFSTSRFVEVAVNKPLDSLFTYSVPEGLEEEARPGLLVLIPWGRKQEVGIIVKAVQHPSIPESKIRSLLAIASPGYQLSPSLISLCQFITDYYGCSLGEALTCASMVGASDVIAEKPLQYRLASEGNHDAAKVLTKRQYEVFKHLQETELPPLTIEELRRSVLSSRSVIEKLIEKKFLTVFDPSEHDSLTLFSERFYELNEEQQVAYDAISTSLTPSAFNVFMLHGITGSGKTEVYLHLIRDVLLRGETALFLVPEISLTPQTLARFVERFGPCVGLFHSQLTKVQKRFLYDQIKSRQIRIVIGARSALFSDLEKLGIIIVDEEHETSYKQNETPRYHARDVAIYYAHQLQIPIVLGSATPSLESYQNAELGKYRLLTLESRATKESLPEIHVVDLGREMKEKQLPQLVSRQLSDAIQKRLAKGEQSLLFLNRRGFSHFLFCPSCNWVARCSNDDMSLTVHSRGKNRKAEEQQDLFVRQHLTDESFQLRCHFCGEFQPVPSSCPECKNEKLATVGIGTQRIEEVLQAEFADARLLRMDHDTVSTRQKFLEAWEEMSSGRAQLILGTQMIAKGIHLEKVTLVGIVLADVGLFQPDFRASERVFSLITQVAGRSGRESIGEVFLQTYMPHQSAIRHAKHHDFIGFYREEMRRRKQMSYPPYTRMSTITILDKDQQRCFRAAQQFAYALNQSSATIPQSTRQEKIDVFGPTLPPVMRHQEFFRYRILLRSRHARKHSALFKTALAQSQKSYSSSTRFQLDVDALDFF